MSLKTSSQVTRAYSALSAERVLALSACTKKKIRDISYARVTVKLIRYLAISSPS